MNFLNSLTWLTWPTALTAAAIAIPVLLILYFLKLRRQTVDVSSTLLWQRAVKDMQANAPFQKLRNYIMLLLQLLVLLLAFLAIAQPQLSGSSSSGAPRTVIFIDRSASMASLDAEDSNGRTVSRLQAAQEQAAAFVDSLEAPSVFSGDNAPEVMVVAFDAAATIVQPFTSSKSQIVRAINNMTPSETPTDFTAAARLTKRFVGPQQVTAENPDDSRFLPGVPARVYSDGNINALEELRLHPESLGELVYQKVGSESPQNFAITAMRAERAFDQPGRVSVYIGVQGAQATPANTTSNIDVRFEVDGAIAAVRPVKLTSDPLDPNAPAQGGVVFTLDNPGSAILSAHVVTSDTPDAPNADVLAADNTTQLVLPPAKRLAIAVVSAEPSMLLRSALNALPLAKLDTIAPAKFESLHSSGGLSSYDVIVLDGWAPRATPDAPFPQGRYLAIDTIPELPGLAPGAPAPSGEGDSTGILTWKRDHPALQYARLDALVMGRTRPVITTSRINVLAQAATGPAILEANTGAAHAIVVAFDPSASTWPLDPGFILFVAEAVDHLAQRRSPLAAGTHTPGSTLSAVIPTSATDVRISTPTGDRISLAPAQDGRVSFGPIEQTGLYALSWAGPPGPQDIEDDAGRVTRTLAVNLIDAHESAITPAAQLALGAGNVGAAGGANIITESPTRLWRWVLLAVLVMLLVEWWVYHRRVAV